MSRSTWTRRQVLDLPAAVDLVTAGSVLGISRTVAHEMAREDRFPVPVLRLGRKYQVPTAPLIKLLGLDPDDQTAARPAEDPAGVEAAAWSEEYTHEQQNFPPGAA